MNLAAGLHQRLSQTLAPQLLQAIEYLQLSTLDLVARIDGELEANEALERRDTPLEPVGPDALERPAGERFDPDAFAARAAGASPAERDAKLDLLANAPAQQTSLRSALEAQLGWVEVADDLRCALDAVFEAIDDRGLLPLDDDALASLVGGAALAQAARGLLRTLEPRGVGARDPLEAMLWQLDPEDPDLPMIDLLLRQHLRALASQKRSTVARTLGVPVEELDRVLDRIARLDPRPGARFAPDEPCPVRVELLVERDPGQLEYRVIVDDQSLPVLGLNRERVDEARDPETEGPRRRQLTEQVRAARELMTAVEMRRDTLLRVGAAVMRRQREFLERGPVGFRALKMSTIAEEVGVHTSTVSRAVAGTHVQTEHGVFALREFFDGSQRGGVGSENEAAGESHDATGRKAILFAIEQLIADENPQKPMSDDELVVAMQARGIEIARRTVAKYRSELGIRSSWQRRKRNP